MTVTSTRAAFVDTNVWLYAFIAGQDPVKHQQAIELINAISQIMLSTQVINEVCVNLLRKEQRPEQDIRDVIDDFYALYQVIEFDQMQLLQASELRERYNLSFWDSLIVSSALASGASVLYSEDMQDGFVVEGRLQVINPFQERENGE